MSDDFAVVHANGLIRDEGVESLQGAAALKRFADNDAGCCDGRPHRVLRRTVSDWVDVTAEVLS